MRRTTVARLLVIGRAAWGDARPGRARTGPGDLPGQERAGSRTRSAPLLPQEQLAGPLAGVHRSSPTAAAGASSPMWRPTRPRARRPGRPTGRRIAFVSNVRGGELELWVMGADGSGQHPAGQ